MMDTARSAPKPTISGLNLERVVGRGPSSIIYRASHGMETVAVEISALASDELSPEQRRQFLRQGCLTASLNHPTIPEVFEVDTTDSGRPYVAREYIAGQILEESIGETVLSPEALIEFGYRIADGLHSVHRRGLIHGDIHPYNILVDTDDIPHLVNFGVDTPGHERSIERLPYVSPEAVELEDSGADARSDLYSLGGVLYFCATARSPFDADTDPGDQPPGGARIAELLAEQRPDIDDRCAILIGELLRTDPAKRPPSARAIVRQLQPVVDTSEIETSQPPVVRRAELQQLLAMWSDVTEGRQLQSVVVEGPTGSGKSHLIDAVARRADREGATHLSVSLREFEPHPLAAVQRLLQTLIDDFDDSDESRKQQIRSAVDAAPDDQFELVIQAIPSISRLRSESPSVSRTDTPRHRSRLLYDAIASLLRRLASIGPGMIVVIDNAHRLDETTRRIFEHLTTLDEAAPVFLVAISDQTMLPESRHNGDSPTALSLNHNIPLGELDAPEIRRLVSERLGDTSVDAALIERVRQASDGNAYFIESYLGALLDAAAIRPHWNQWSLDDQAIQQLELPETIAELIDHRLSSLRDSTRELLTWIALFESPPSRRDLVDSSGIDTATIDAAAREAMTAGLMEVDPDGRWRLTDAPLRGRLVESTGVDERRRRHQRIALTLSGRADSGDFIFPIARHFARGETDQTPQRAITANHRAGTVARRHCAFEQSLNCLTEAVAIAEQHDIEPTRQLHADIGEVAVRTGHLDVARRHLDAAIGATDDPVERARLRTSVIGMHSTALKVDRAKEEIRRAFWDLDEPLPQRRPVDIASTLSQWSRAELTTRFPSLKSILHSSHDDASRRQLEVLMELYAVSTRVAYLDFDETRFVQLMMRNHNLAVQLDAPSELAKTHISLAFVAANIGSDRWYKSHQQRAREQAQRASDRSIDGAVDIIEAMSMELRGNIRGASQMMETTVVDHGHWIDAWEYTSGTLILVGKACLRGHFRKALDIAEQAIRQLRTRQDQLDSQQGFLFTAIAAMALMPMSILGETKQADDYLKLCDQYFANTDEKLYYHAVIHHALVGYHLVEANDDAVVDHMESVFQLPMSFPDIPYFLRSFLVWRAWFLLRRARRQRRRDNTVELDELRDAIDDLRAGSRTSIYEAYCELFSAGLADLEERRGDIDAHLVDARRLADDVGMPIIHFEIAVFRARLQARRGADDIAMSYLRRARQLARDSGWTAYLRRLRTEFDALEDHASTVDTAASTDRAVDEDTDHRLNFVDRARRRLQTTGDDNAALSEMLHEFADAVGASRALLFRREDEHLTLEQTSDDAVVSPRDDLSDSGRPSNWARGVIDQVFATEQPLVVATARQGRRWDEQAFGDELQSAVAIPLSTARRLSGILYLDGSKEQLFDDGDVELLQLLTPALIAIWQTLRADTLHDELQRTGQQRTTLLEHATRAVGIGLTILTPDQELKTASPIVYTLAQPWGSLPQWWRQVEPRCQWDHTKMCSQCGELEFLGTALADVTTSDGERHIFELTSTGHGHELTDEPTDHMVLVQDATDRISAQEELETLNDELVDARDEAMAASRAKSSFLANMSHELRTPLNAIIGYSEMLLEEADDSDSQMLQDLRRIQVSGKHLLELVSDILNLSKIETGRLDLDIRPIQLPALIDDIADTALQLVSERGNTLVVDDAPPVEIVNDETKLRQVLLNLLGNAAKFTEGGEIRLGIDVDDDSQPSGDRWLRFHVTDDGIGMSDEELESLFEAFYQATPGSVSEHGGTGLGLTISQRFCELMGGTIDVDSTEGVGTTFTIRIPCVVDA